MPQASIGVLMIVKNAEKNLEKTLLSVCDWVNEIVIVDSGSTDNTLNIANRFTTTLYQHEWLGFGPQRQLAQRYITTDWVLALDADEEVSEMLKYSILQMMAKDKGDNTLYQVNRLTEAFGKFIRYSGWYPDKITRLYPRLATQYNDALVHESVKIPPGYQIKLLEGPLYHYTIDSIPNYIGKTQQYIAAWVEQREGKKHSSLSGAIAHGLFRFLKMYFLKRGFLDGRHGLLLAILSANVIFTRYADLWLRDYMKKQVKKKESSPSSR